MAELADALDLGSSGDPCRFKSCHPHHIERIDHSLFFIILVISGKGYSYEGTKITGSAEIFVI